MPTNTYRGTSKPPPGITPNGGRRRMIPCARCGRPWYWTSGDNGSPDTMCNACRRQETPGYDVPDLGDGACVGHAFPEWWTTDRPNGRHDPTPGLAARMAEWRAALYFAASVCAECPVIRECRDYALRHGENAGVWGGMYLGGNKPVSLLGKAEPGTTRILG